MKTPPKTTLYIMISRDCWTCAYVLPCFTIVLIN